MIHYAWSRTGLVCFRDQKYEGKKHEFRFLVNVISCERTIVVVQDYLEYVELVMKALQNEGVYRVEVYHFPFFTPNPHGNHIS